MAWLWLALAISSGVAGTISLRLASERSKGWWLGVAIGYLVAYSLLVVSLSNGIPLGAAYGIWAACSVGLTAILGGIFFGERLNGVVWLGLILIVGGVLLLELGTTTKPVKSEEPKMMVGAEASFLESPLSRRSVHSKGMS